MNNNHLEEEPYCIKSSLKPFKYPDVTFSEYLSDKISKIDPNHVALITSKSGNKITYGQLHLVLQELASGLLECGITENDSILFHGDNSIQYLLMFLACTYLGVCISPISPANGSYELLKQAQDFGATTLIIDREKLPTLINAMNQEQFKIISPNIKLMIVMNELQIPTQLYQHINAPAIIYTYEDVYQKGVGQQLSSIPMFPIQPTDHYLIIYTSGSTGLPKGAIHTQYTWLTSIIAMERYHQSEKIKSKCQVLNFPFGHLSGTIFICYTLLNAITAIITTDTSLDNVIKLIEKYRADLLFVTQNIAVDLATNHFEEKYDLTCIKQMQHGGSKIPVKILQIIQEKFPHVEIKEIWGMTEIPSAIRIRNFGEPECLPGNVGTLEANHELKIVDITDGHNLPAFEHGEICIRGPICFAGYLNNESITKLTIDANGWCHTGDIGYYDQYGALYIVDRLKEMIKYKGWSLFPAEIEDFIFQNPKVKNVCVVGVKHITDGHLPRAYIKLKADQKSIDQKMFEEELNESFRKNFGFQKRLRGGIVFVDTIPKTSIGKNDRSYFRNLVKNEIMEKTAFND